MHFETPSRDGLLKRSVRFLETVHGEGKPRVKAGGVGRAKGTGVTESDPHAQTPHGAERTARSSGRQGARSGPASRRACASCPSRSGMLLPLLRRSCFPSSTPGGGGGGGGAEKRGAAGASSPDSVGKSRRSWQARGRGERIEEAGALYQPAWASRDPRPGAGSKEYAHPAGRCKPIRDLLSPFFSHFPPRIQKSGDQS